MKYLTRLLFTRRKLDKMAEKEQEGESSKVKKEKKKKKKKDKTGGLFETINLIKLDITPTLNCMIKLEVLFIFQKKPRNRGESRNRHQRQVTIVTSTVARNHGTTNTCETPKNMATVAITSDVSDANHVIAQGRHDTCADRALAHRAGARNRRNEAHEMLSDTQLHARPRAHVMKSECATTDVTGQGRGIDVEVNRLTMKLGWRVASAPRPATERD